MEQARKQIGQIFAEHPTRKIEDEEARRTLRPIRLSNKNGYQFTVLPVICRERGSIRQYLERNWGDKIDVVTVSISEGDDSINRVQQEMRENPNSNRSSRFKAQYGFGILGKQNPSAIMVMSDEVLSAAGCFPVDGRLLEIRDEQSVLIAKHDLG